ncbi:MAG: aspartate-semialdehyde dehydrogenase, partial [Planctomycetota bacterium]
MSGLTIAVAGATGAVGREMLGVLEEREFPVERLIPLASERSAGSTVTFRGEEITVQALGQDSFAGVDLALY